MLYLLKRKGFTLIELLAVIGIIILVMGMALPGLAAMMGRQRWNAVVSDIQVMVMRARTLAASVRRDFAVEFDITSDNGTRMWIEAELNHLERIPDLWELQHQLGGYAAIADFMKTFYASGGRYKYWCYECACTSPGCDHTWSVYSGKGGSTTICPKCHVDRWRFRPRVLTFYYDITFDPKLAVAGEYADNTRQREIVRLGRRVTIDLTKCRHFVSWDAPDSVVCYGGDAYGDELQGENRDIRIGTNGALVQTREPLICLKLMDREEYRALKVVRCTGRVVPTPVPD